MFKNIPVCKHLNHLKDNTGKYIISRVAENFLNKTQKAEPFKMDEFNILKIKYVHQRVL